MSDLTNNGWNRDLEDESVIKELTKPRLPKAFRTFAKPAEVRCDIGANPHKLENQGPMGSCNGFAISSCVEQLHYVATQGERVQLSAIFSYLAVQKKDGLIGRDQGSTIFNGVKLATTTGICPQANAEYPSPVRYPNKAARKKILSQANYDAGAPFKIRSSVGIKSHKDALDFIGAGGVISIGIAWSPRFRNINGRKTVTSIANGGGGHALCCAGYKRNGNIIVINSHNYFFDVPPKQFDQMLRHRYTVAIGLSDLVTPVPRDLSFLKKKLRETLGTRKDLWS